MPPVVENVFGMTPYDVFAIVAYLQVAFSLVATEIVVEVIPAFNDPVGCGLLATGGVVSPTDVVVKAKDVLWDANPDTPVTVTVDKPAGALAEAETVSVELQLDVHDVGKNEAVIPAGRPETERETDWGAPTIVLSVIVFVTA